MTLMIVRPDFLRPTRHKTLWLWTIVFSLAFLIWFAATIDTDTLVDTVARIDRYVLATALFCLIANGLADAVWLTLISGRRDAYGGAFRVVAWHMLASSILPARLGDIAWMYFMHRWLDLSAGRAMFIALYHRLQDFLVTSVFFLFAILVVGVDELGASFGVVAAIMFCLMVLLVVFLEQVLTGAALVLKRLHRAFGRRVSYHLLRQLLQVRLWYRHRLPRSLIWISIVIIALRWAAVLIGIGILIHAVAGTLTWRDSLFLTNAYIFLGSVPVQAIGGFGAGEAGLAWLLVLYGLSVGRASAISLMLRMLVNIVHVAIWLATIAVLQLHKLIVLRRSGL